eukprot:COSAG01_NODE_56343_length_319_cov_0.650000_1_plen_92_part_10
MGASPQTRQADLRVRQSSLSPCDAGVPSHYFSHEVSLTVCHTCRTCIQYAAHAAHAYGMPHMHTGTAYGVTHDICSNAVYCTVRPIASRGRR